MILDPKAAAHDTKHIVISNILTNYYLETGLVHLLQLNCFHGHGWRPGNPSIFSSFQVALFLLHHGGIQVLLRGLKVYIWDRSVHSTRAVHGPGRTSKRSRSATVDLYGRLKYLALLHSQLLQAGDFSAPGSQQHCAAYTNWWHVAQ